MPRLPGADCSKIKSFVLADVRARFADVLHGRFEIGDLRIQILQLLKRVFPECGAQRLRSVRFRRAAWFR